MVRVPGLTDAGIVTSHYTEHVDLFPTLVEAAAGVKMETCPAGSASFHVPLCTEGSSLVPLMRDPSRPVKSASFSQYPRRASKCIRKGAGCTMGYTLVTQVDGHEYRYTEWADFNTPGHQLKVDWGRIVGVELYNHSADPGENFNINATQPYASTSALSAELSRRLHAGPEAARLSAADGSVGPRG